MRPLFGLIQFRHRLLEMFDGLDTMATQSPTAVSSSPRDFLDLENRPTADCSMDGFAAPKDARHRSTLPA